MGNIRAPIARIITSASASAALAALSANAFSPVLLPLLTQFVKLLFGPFKTCERDILEFGVWGSRICVLALEFNV